MRITLSEYADLHVDELEIGAVKSSRPSRQHRRCSYRSHHTAAALASDRSHCLGLYIYISHLADTFIQAMRAIEAIKINKRAIICYNIYIYISAVKRLIAINRIQFVLFFYIMCMYFVYLLCIYK